MQKFGEVKFSKDRVKIQIWGKPVIFISCMHELCPLHNEILSGGASGLVSRLQSANLAPRPNAVMRGLGPRLCVRMRTKSQNGVLR